MPISELDARTVEQKLVGNEPLTHEESLALFELLQVVRTGVESGTRHAFDRQAAWNVVVRSYRGRFTV